MKLLRVCVRARVLERMCVSVVWEGAVVSVWHCNILINHIVGDTWKSS